MAGVTAAIVINAECGGGGRATVFLKGANIQGPLAASFESGSQCWRKSKRTSSSASAMTQHRENKGSTGAASSRLVALQTSR